MFRGSKVLSIIPARKGSKGLANKNMLSLGGKPLIHWTIMSSLKSRFIDNTLITSDSEQVLNYGKSFNLMLRNRPNEFAGDDISMVDVLKNLFDKEPELLEKYKYLILLQPTSPLRTEKHIMNSFIQLGKNKKSDSIISAIREESSILKNLILSKNGFLEEISTDGYFSMNRQRLPQVFKPNGAIYLMRIEEFLNTGKLISENTIPFEMEKEDSCDIDSLEDYNHVKSLFNLS